MQDKPMDENELSIVVQNDKEWRKLIFRKLEKLEDSHHITDRRVIKLEVKNALYGSALGMVFGMFGSYLFKMM